MLFDLNECETETLLKNGSTNQKNFIEKAIKAGKVEEVFKLLEDLINEEILIINESQDIRSYINGGVLFLTDAAEAKELNDNYFVKYEINDNLVLCIE